MRKLQLLTAGAGVVLALSGSSFAAKRAHHSSGAYSAYATGADSDRFGAYYYGPNRLYSDSVDAATQRWGAPGYSNIPQQNLPYPDRRYGDPGRW